MAIVLAGCGAEGQGLPAATTTADAREERAPATTGSVAPPIDTTTSLLPAPAEPTQPGGIGLDSQRGVREAYYPHLQGEIEREWGTVPLVLSPGEWATDQLGTPITIALDESLMLWEANPDYLELAPATTTDAQSRSLLAIMRPSWITAGPMAGDPDAAQSRLGAAVPAPNGGAELALWLDQVPQIVVEEMADTEIGGRPATRFTLGVDPEMGGTHGCVIGAACVSMWVPTSCECRRLQVPLAVSDNAISTVWIIDEPGADLVIVARALQSDAVFVETAARIVERLSFGSPQEQLVPANSVLAVGFPNRTRSELVSFPSVAGLTMNLDGRWFEVVSGILAVGSDLSDFGSYPSNADFHIYGPLFAPGEQAGEPGVPFTDLESVVEFLRATERVGVTEVGEATMLGRDAEVYDLEDAELLGLADGPAGGGDISIKGAQRLWLLDGPNGPWAVFARSDLTAEAAQLFEQARVEG